MASEKATFAPNPRLNALFDSLLDTLRTFIRENHVTHDEYRRAVAFLSEVGQKGEVSLLCDVAVEVTVDEVENNGRPGTITTIEGPYYVPRAPLLKSPCALPHRADEPGDLVLFSGTVRSSTGRSLPEAVLDLWQSDANGRYSHFNIPEAVAPYNLRGRVTTNHEGRFEIETRIPGPYEIPNTGPTGALLAAMGRHAWRPAHLHVKVQHPGYRSLTTQLFLKNDPWLESDVVEGAVKEALIVDPVKEHDRYVLSYDLALEPNASKTF